MGDWPPISEVLAIKHESRILGQWLNPVSGPRNSQASSPCPKQHGAYPVPSWRNHIQGWMSVRGSYSHALEQRTLPGCSLTARKLGYGYLPGKITLFAIAVVKVAPFPCNTETPKNGRKSSVGEPQFHSSLNVTFPDKIEIN